MNKLLLQNHFTLATLLIHTVIGYELDCFVWLCFCWLQNTAVGWDGRGKVRWFEEKPYQSSYDSCTLEVSKGHRVMSGCQGVISEIVPAEDPVKCSDGQHFY